MPSDKILIQVVTNGYIVGCVGDSENRKIFKKNEKDKVLKDVEELIDYVEKH